MGPLGKFAFISAFGLLASASAMAADMPTPYIPEQPAPQYGGWYLRGYIGMTNQFYDGLEYAGFDDPAYFGWLDTGGFGASPLYGVGIGYQLSNWFRFDVTGEYRGKAPFSAMDIYDTSDNPPDFGNGDPTDWGTNHYEGFKSEWLFLANGYIDIGNYYGFTPYIGAGIGMSRNTISDFTDTNVIQGGGGYADAASVWSFAWALHAGLAFRVTQNFIVDLGYSYTHLGNARTGILTNLDPMIGCGSVCEPVTFKNIGSHDVKIGFRYMFN
jgi:opacity protein-like surface antigen